MSIEINIYKTIKRILEKYRSLKQEEVKQSETILEQGASDKEKVIRFLIKKANEEIIKVEKVLANIEKVIKNLEEIQVTGKVKERGLNEPISNLYLIGITQEYRYMLSYVAIDACQKGEFPIEIKPTKYLAIHKERDQKIEALCGLSNEDKLYYSILQKFLSEKEVIKDRQLTR